MLDIQIVCVGNLKDRYWIDACNEYQKRLSRFCSISVSEMPESNPGKEKDSILKNLKGYVIALCVEGEKTTSEGFAMKIDKISQSSQKITLVIGGSDGLDPEVKKRADWKLSFSDMTFPHRLMRVILFEQLYRAFTILNNITYHK